MKVLAKNELIGSDSQNAIFATLEKAEKKLLSQNFANNPAHKIDLDRLALKTVALATIQKELSGLVECGIGLQDARVAVLSIHGRQLQQDIEGLIGLL